MHVCAMGLLCFGRQLLVIHQPERHVVLLGYWSSNLHVKFLKVYCNINVGYKEYILIIFFITLSICTCYFTMKRLGANQGKK